MSNAQIFNITRNLETNAMLPNQITYQINVNWVPGHTGFDGNEWADSLAKRGKFRPKTELKYKYPISNLRLKIKKFFENKLIQKYKALSEESHTITDELLKAGSYKLYKIRKILLQLDSKEISILVKVLSGHNNLNNHLYRSKLTYTKFCEYCNEPDDPDHTKSTFTETATHILTQCPAFASQRAVIYMDYFIQTDEIFKNKSVLKGIREIVTFFKKIKVLNRKPKLSKNDLSPPRTWPRKRKNEEATDEAKNKKTKLTSVDTNHHNLMECKHLTF